MTKQVVTFAAGPSKLPKEVLQQAQKEFLDYAGTGLSVLEFSHRSKEFEGILNTAKQDLRDILSIPDNYEILFLPAGGVGQFAAVPLNLKNGDNAADYVVTGGWSEKAAQEAQSHMKVNLVLPKTKSYTGAPDQSTWKLTPNASYLYYCDNETVHGVEFGFVPNCPANVPLVCDMSSNILTRKVDVSKYGMIFAGAQKNLGGAGVTLVIIRKDLLDRKAEAHTPTVLNYKTMADNNSLINTPPCFNIYLTGLVLKWVKANGGIEGMQKWSKDKSGLIYDAVDKSNDFYYCPVQRDYRSRVNLPFKIGGSAGNEQLEKLFLDEAKKRGLIELKGHRSVGGIRASLYNAMTVEETRLLSNLMQEFYLNNKI